MANAFFSFSPFDFEIQGGLSPPQLEDYDKDDTLMLNVRKVDHLFGLEDQLGEMNAPSSEHGFCQDNKAKKGVHSNKAGKDHQRHHYQQQQQHFNSSSSNLENFSSFDFTFSSGQGTESVEDGAWFTHSHIGGSDIVETNKKLLPPQSSLATLELPNSYGSAFKRLKGGRQRSSKVVQGKEIDQNSSDVVSGLCEEETNDVELARLLLAAAEKVGYQQFERASRLLLQCEWIASFKGTPVPRVVCYFAKALGERIEKETGLYASKGNEEMSQHVWIAMDRVDGSTERDECPVQLGSSPILPYDT
ncbi:uncharacterized protein LOC112178448 [Rosa chinensis]|uniref:uncharacterized protein LOC112178448 n=1 Tax=Rosa chinensis TaxID=74649 RepID=UPI000D09259C|nr:uncharacterized protein LOC112178448 [Rosa chinensis]